MVRATCLDRRFRWRGQQRRDARAHRQNGLLAPFPGGKRPCLAAIPTGAGSWPPPPPPLGGVQADADWPSGRRAPADGAGFTAAFDRPASRPPTKERAAGAYLNADPRNGDTVTIRLAVGAGPGQAPGGCDLSDHTCASTPTTPPDHHNEPKAGSGLRMGKNRASFPPCPRPGPGGRPAAQGQAQG